MSVEIIDSYRRNAPAATEQRKKSIYERALSQEEQDKTLILYLRFAEFEQLLRGEEGHFDLDNSIQGRIFYRSDLGSYIALSENDDGEVQVFEYGDDEEKVFIDAVIERETSFIETHYLFDEPALEERFKKRIPHGEKINKSGLVQFFSAEMALNDFRRFYAKEDIPESIVEHFEKVASDAMGQEFKFDSESGMMRTRQKLYAIQRQRKGKKRASED